MDKTKKDVMTWLLAASICGAVIGTKSSGFDNVSPHSASSPELPPSQFNTDVLANHGNNLTNICTKAKQLVVNTAALSADEPIALGQAAASYVMRETPTQCRSTHRYFALSPQALYVLDLQELTSTW